MSGFNNLIDMIKPSDDEQQQISPVSEKMVSTNLNQPFDISVFGDELYNKSENKNRIMHQLSQNINAYDLAHNCIRAVVYKLLNTPVRSFATKWLPVLLRSTIGTAIHDFIQSTTNQFTESEISIKIPSIKFSGRIDNLIGNNILVEIKSCNYTDYQKIIKKSRPRDADFYQTIVYKYILENYLNEAKDSRIQTRTNKPKLNSYNIDKIQFIYVAHDIMASDVEDFGEILNRIKVLKQTLNSKSNVFYFMTTIVLDTNTFDVNPYVDYIKSKISAVHDYLNKNKLPGSNDPFVDPKNCYFCIYSEICNIK